jgi:hypothetical protein
VLVFILQGLLSFGNGNSGSFYKLWNKNSVKYASTFQVLYSCYSSATLIKLQCIPILSS